MSWADDQVENPSLGHSAPHGPLTITLLDEREELIDMFRTAGSVPNTGDMVALKNPKRVLWVLSTTHIMPGSDVILTCRDITPPQKGNETS